MLSVLLPMPAAHLRRWASRPPAYRRGPPGPLLPLRFLATVATHSGTFHCDEALATALLRRHPRFAQLALTRTRDPALVRQADVVLDVGGIYDPLSLRFDHHQRSFVSTFDEQHTVRLSSAGLVWKHFGRDIVAHHFAHLSPADVDIVWIKLYDDVVQSIDAIDNGIAIAEGTQHYSVQTDLSSRVRRLNPRWNEEATDADRDARFADASALAGQEFWDIVQDVVSSWLPARALVRTALLERETRVPGAHGQVLTLPCATPWKQHLQALELELEPELGLERAAPILYVLYPDEQHWWRVQAVPGSPGSFTSRKALPEPWRGVRDEHLARVTGIPDSTFVHASGFIGGARTFEGAVAMARTALAWAPREEGNA